MDRRLHTDFPASNVDGTSVFSRETWSQEESNLNISGTTEETNSLLDDSNEVKPTKDLVSSPPQNNITTPQQSNSTNLQKLQPPPQVIKKKQRLPPRSILKRPKPDFVSSSGRRVVMIPNPRKNRPFDESSEEGSLQPSAGGPHVVSPENQQRQKQHYRITMQENKTHRMEEHSLDQVPEEDTMGSSSGNGSRVTWDSSDRQQFPMMEIQRMKRKTSMLRNQNGNNLSAYTEFPPFDPHAGFQIQSSPPRRSRGSVGSCTTGSSNSSRGSLGSQDSPISVRKSKHGNIWTNSPNRQDTDSVNSSLPDIANHHQPAQNVGITSEAEQFLRESFMRPGRRRAWKHQQAQQAALAQQQQSQHHQGATEKTKPSTFPVKVPRSLGGRESDTTTDTSQADESITHDSSQAKNDEETTQTTSRDDPPPPPPQEEEVEEPDFTLHDLCGEASSTDDIAWRNALYALSLNPDLASVCDTFVSLDQDEVDDDLEDEDEESLSFLFPERVLRQQEEQQPKSGGRVEPARLAPLHIACLGLQPPPTFIIRALLIANPRVVRWRDHGGRLPLHMIAASSADVTIMEMLLQEWPAAIYKRDDQGLTPLHYLLLNKAVLLTVHNVSVLLGLKLSGKRDSRQAMFEQQKQYLLQRRGQHLNMSLSEMEQYLQYSKKNPVTVFNPEYDERDSEWNTYPPDVQVALRQLAKWRRRQVQSEKNQGGIHKSEEEEDDEDFTEETNPAAIPHYPDLKLPIHMAVARGIVQVAPMEIDKFDDEQEETDSDDQEVGTYDFHSKKRKQQYHPQSSVVDVYNVLRCIIAAFPEGLCVRDACGKTPLLHIMTMTDGLPTLDLIELLLGKRSGAFREIPEWLSDIPLHSITTLPANDNQYLCPAMVVSASHYQLPLHIAAEEFLADPSIVETIHKSYPAATDVQDHKGRTPLHLMFSNYRLFPANPKVVSLLLSDSAAKTLDVEGNLPFDLLVEAAHSLPKRLPATWEADEMARVYQKFFTASVTATTIDGKLVDPADFLRQLRQLPPWIRRQSCSVPFVQEMIIEELSSPWRTALVVFEGILLVTILILLRSQVKDFTDGDALVQVSESSAEKWYSSSLHSFVSIRLAILLLRSALSANVGQLYYLILLNGWFWVDFCAMMFTLMSASMFNGDIDDSPILSTVTVATGLLWLSLIGFCATWFFGMALLLGSLSKITNQILWPVIAGGMVSVSFAQMFYTLLWTECNSAIPTSPVCTTRDSYRVVYLLLRGDPLVVPDGSDEMSDKAIFLLSGFLILAFLLILAILVAVIMGVLYTDTDEVAFRSFWEPKLAFVLSSADWGCEKKRKYSIASKMGLDTRLERNWDLFVSSLFFGIPSRIEKKWYSICSSNTMCHWTLPVVALAVVPVWFVLGFVTLGFLWPPQLRRMLFRPLGWENKRRSRTTLAEHVASQLSDVRSELVRVKTMSYERSVQVEREIRDVKHFLHAAMYEKD